MSLEDRIAKLEQRLAEDEAELSALKAEVHGESEVLTEVRDVKNFTDPHISSPVEGTTFTGTTVLFQWTTDNETVWQFYIESQDGATNYHTTPSLQGGFRQVDTLPENGEAIRARLVGTKDGETKEIIVNYTAWTKPATEVLPSITSHVDGGSVNAGDTFTWSAGSIGEDITKWWLIIGIATDTTSIYNSGEITDPLKRSHTSNGSAYPAVDETVIAKLSYWTDAVGWRDVDPINLSWDAPTATNQSNLIHSFAGIMSSKSALEPSGPLRLIGSQHNNRVIEGLIFDPPYDLNEPIIYIQDADNVTVQNCLLRGDPVRKQQNNNEESYNSHGIRLNGAENTTIRWNDIYNTNMGVRGDALFDWDIYENQIHNTRYGAVSLTNCRGNPGASHSIHNNHCFGSYEANTSRDMIAYYQCIGISEGDRLRIDDNFVQLVNSRNLPYNGGKNGGGIMLGDGGDWSGKRQQYLGARGNAILNGGHYLATIQGGHRCELDGNWGFMDEINANNNRGVGMPVFNQDGKTNTDFGWHTITNNRMNARGRNSAGDEVQNDKFFRNNADDRQSTWTVSGNEYGSVTEAEVLEKGLANTVNARCFDHVLEYDART